MEVTLIDKMGSDVRVADAARVSFKKIVPDAVLRDSDVKLINYLASHGHWTPFGHVTITLHQKMPIFIARQFAKHTVGFVTNEVSRRYVDDEPEFYYPSEWRVRPIGSVKQGSGTEKLPEPDFVQGYCRCCGECVDPIERTQGGGRSRIYCSDNCKYKYNNLNRNPYKHIWNNAKARAKREGKEWSIKFDTFNFPSHCPVLDIEIDYSIGKGQIQDNSPSFDRIDSSKWYIDGNVRLISNKANTMKSNASDEELIKFAENILLTKRGIIVDKSFSYDSVIQKAKELYKVMIKEGYSPEMARSVLPQSMYTEMYTTGSLAAWARAYKLRIDPHAQKEIQDLANMWQEVIGGIKELEHSWSALTQ